MKNVWQYREIESHLEAAGIAEAASLVIGKAEDVPGDVLCMTSTELMDAGALGKRVALGVCLEPARDDAPVLAKLRDLYCDQVLLVQSQPVFEATELLALGYQERSRLGAAVAYLCSPDINDQPREWNNATNWANPENFRKHRW